MFSVHAPSTEIKLGHLHRTLPVSMAFLVAGGDLVRTSSRRVNGFRMSSVSAYTACSTVAHMHMHSRRLRPRVRKRCVSRSPWILRREGGILVGFDGRGHGESAGCPGWVGVYVYV